MPDIQRADMTLQPASDSGERYTFIVNSGNIMRSKRRLSPTGWQLDNYSRNPVVLLNHAISEPPIGSARAWTDGDGLKAEVTFADTPRAQEIAQLVRTGFIRSASAGWLTPPDQMALIRENGRVTGIQYNRQELIEISIVTVPDDTGAMLAASFEAMDVIEELRAYVALAIDAINN